MGGFGSFTQAGNLDEVELERQGEKPVSNAHGGMPKHGRRCNFHRHDAPRQHWAAGPGTTQAMVTPLTTLQDIALTSRVLLVYVLPTLGARLTFLCQSNPPGNLSVSISLLVACCSWVVALGGLLHCQNGASYSCRGPVCASHVRIHRIHPTQSCELPNPVLRRRECLRRLFLPHRVSCLLLTSVSRLLPLPLSFVLTCP